MGATLRALVLVCLRWSRDLANYILYTHLTFCIPLVMSQHRVLRHMSSSATRTIQITFSLTFGTFRKTNKKKHFLRDVRTAALLLPPHTPAFGYFKVNACAREPHLLMTTSRRVGIYVNYRTSHNGRGLIDEEKIERHLLNSKRRGELYYLALVVRSLAFVH